MHSVTPFLTYHVQLKPVDGTTMVPVLPVLVCTPAWLITQLLEERTGTRIKRPSVRLLSMSPLLASVDAVLCYKTIQQCQDVTRMTSFNQFTTREISPRRVLVILMPSRYWESTSLP